MENTLYSTNKYSCVRWVHTLYISHSDGKSVCHGGYVTRRVILH